MAFRQILRSIIRSTRPVVYASSTLFVNTESMKKPSADKKITLEQPDPKNLSFDYMIKQSTVDAVNTASQVLTVTYSAIEATSREYRSLLSRLISLISETLTHEVCDSHWDRIVEIRAEVELKKQVVTQLVSFMDYVHKMAVAASETTYLAGMDNLSTTLCQRIDDALTNMQNEIDTTKEDVSQDQQEEQDSPQTFNVELDELVQPISS